VPPSKQILTSIACGANRYANWGLSGRTGEMLIKNFVGKQLPFPISHLPSYLLFFFLYFHIFSRPRLRNMEERFLPAIKRHLVNFGGERVLLVRAILVIINHIIHLFTIKLLTGQSATPAGGRPRCDSTTSHPLAPPLLSPF